MCPALAEECYCIFFPYGCFFQLRPFLSGQWWGQITICRPVVSRSLNCNCFIHFFYSPSFPFSSTHCGDFISIISRVDLSTDTINSTVDIFAQLHQVLLFSIKFVELLPVKLLLPRKQTYPTRNQNLRNFQLNTPPNSKSINAPRRSLQKMWEKEKKNEKH